MAAPRQSDEPLRILVVSNFLPPQNVGGAELVASREMQVLHERGHAVAGFTLDWTNVASIRGHREDFEVRRVPTDETNRTRAGLETRRTPSTERRFAEHLAAFEPNLVHFHNQSGFTLRLPSLARRTGIPVVATFHDAFGLCPNHALFRPDGARCEGFRSLACVPCLEGLRGQRLSPRRRLLLPFRNVRVRRKLRLLDRLVFPSHYYQDRYVAAGYPRLRCCVLANPIDPAAYREARAPVPDGNGPLRVLFLGTSSPLKGLDVLLEAIAGMPRATARLRIHGRTTPDALHQMQSRLRALGIQDLVEHGGPLRPDEVPRAMLDCDTVVVPSVLEESAPLTLIEAMAARRPVVASKIGGIPELVHDGSTGFLVPPRDAQSLAVALKRLADDRGLLHDMGNEAGRHCAAHDIDTHVDQLLDLYREVLGERRGAGA